jgi:putative transcription antitermination factor YqgF
LPLDAEGKETAKSLEVRQFGNLLKKLSKKPVEYQNEHGSSLQATKDAISMGYSQKNRKTTDQIAAAIILKNYYNEN